MFSHPPIRVLVPTWNNADTIDATVESVLAQDVDPAKVFLFFVDFGSTDGTLEKLYSLSSKNKGILTIPSVPQGRILAAHAARTMILQNVSGREFLLWPGDVLYPHCFREAELWLKKIFENQLAIGTLAMEVDVKDPDGNVRRQSPLFSSAGIFRAFSSDSKEYVGHGYRHQILLYNFPLSWQADKIGVYVNHHVYWNDLAYAGLFRDISYIQRPAACVCEYAPPDEMDNLLFRFEVGLTCFRMGGEVAEGHVLGAGYESLYRHNLAKYALWRSWLAQKRGENHTAEDCFVFARVIDARMAGNDGWRRMERWLADGGEEDGAWLESWFAEEEKTLEPKWPLGGMVRRWQRQWKVWRTKDRPSAWGC